MFKTKVMFVALFIIAGCAAVPIPPDQLASNESSIRGAEELGALDVPAARLHLEMAKDETATAKRLAANGDDRAGLVLARAESDAELALGIARELSVHNEAERAAADLKAVQSRGTP